ncbi:MAG: hypothetical protein M1812_006553 [Candelaria pacifica]|nr:MAG: hypothetical protein M1812_006553 [Candelaria pacifica]
MYLFSSTLLSPSSSSSDVAITSTSFSSTVKTTPPSTTQLNESLPDTIRSTPLSLSSSLITGSLAFFDSRTTSTSTASVFLGTVSSRSTGLASSQVAAISTIPATLNGSVTQFASSSSSLKVSDSATISLSNGTSTKTSSLSDVQVGSVHLPSDSLIKNANRSLSLTGSTAGLSTRFHPNRTTNGAPVPSSYGTIAYYAGGTNYTEGRASSSGGVKSIYHQNTTMSSLTCTTRTRKTVTITRYIATVETTITISSNDSTPFTTTINSTSALPNVTRTHSWSSHATNRTGVDLPECPSSLRGYGLDNDPEDGAIFLEQQPITTTALATSKRTVLVNRPETSIPNFGTPASHCGVGLGRFMHRRGCVAAVQESSDSALATPETDVQPGTLLPPLHQDQPQSPTQASAQSGSSPDGGHQGSTNNGIQGPAAVGPPNPAVKTPAPEGVPNLNNPQPQPVGSSPPSNEQLSGLGTIIASVINGASPPPASNNQQGSELKANQGDGSNSGSSVPAAAPAADANRPAQNPGSQPSSDDAQHQTEDDQFQHLGSIIASVINGAVAAPESNNQRVSNPQASQGQGSPSPVPGAVPVSNPPKPTQVAAGAGADSGSGSPPISDGPPVSDGPPISGGKAADNIPTAEKGEKPVVGTQAINAAPEPTIVVNGQNFAIQPSQLVAPGTTIAIPANGPGGENSPSIIINGQNFQVNPSQLISPGTTIALPNVISSNSPPFIQQQGLGVIPTPLTIAGQTASVNAAGDVVIGGQTVAPGANAITLDGTPVSIGASGFVVGASTIPLAKLPEASPVVTIADQVITPSPVAAGYVVTGSTIAQGAPAMTVLGTPISLGPSGLVVGGSNVQLAEVPKASPVATVAGQVITPAPVGGNFVVGESTIAQGAPAITIEGTPISLGPSGLVVGGSTVQLANVPGVSPVFTVAGQVITPAPVGGNFVVGGSTIAQGAPAITIGGTPVSLGPSGIVIGGSTVQPANIPGANPVATVAGQVITPAPVGVFVVGGSTIAQGAPAITIGGTPVSLGPSGIVVGGSTVQLANVPGASPVATVAGQLITATPVAGGYVVAGSTIEEGASAITISGTPVSLGAAGIVVGSNTVQLPAKSVFNIAGQAITANSDGFILAANAPQGGSLGSLTPITAGGIIFSVGSRVAVVDGMAVGLDTPVTKMINGQVVSFGPGGIGLVSTTIALPSAESVKPITAGGLTFSLGQSVAFIDGTSFNLASPTTKVVNGKAISIGPNGIGLDSTTIPLPGLETLRPVTAGGLSFSIGSSVAVIDGSSFNLATPTTKVLNGQTISIGPNGIGFPTTTVPIAGSLVTPTPVTAGGITFGLGPSIAVIDGTTFTLNPNNPATIKTLANGQTISIGPNGIGFPTTTVPIGGSLVTPTPITAGGITFGLSPSIAVIDGTTFTLNPNSPATIKTLANGQTISIGPSGIGFATTTVPIPNSLITPTPVTAGGITFSLSPSIAIIDGTTFTVNPNSPATTKTLANGQIISIGPKGIGFATTTIPIPNPSALITGTFSTTTINGIPLALGSNIAVINGTTFSIGPGATPTTDIIDGQTISIGPNGIGFASTTIPIPTTTAPAFLKSTTVNGIPLAIGSSIAVINGTTFLIGPGATPTTDLINGQTISIGPNGIGFASTTIPIPNASISPSLRFTTVNGITLALGSSIAVINGTTFGIGPGATPTIDVINGQTVSLGPGGVGFSSTTVGAPFVTKTGSAGSEGGGNRKNNSARGRVGIGGKGGLGFVVGVFGLSFLMGLV